MSKKKKNSGSARSNQIVLIFLIVFVVISVVAVFWVKLADLSYLGKNETVMTIKNPAQPKISKEPVDFSGVISSLDKEKKSISFKGLDLVQQKQANLNFLVNEGTEITLAGNQEKISLADLQTFDSIVINAYENQDGSWTANKIQVTETNVISGKVVAVEKNKITIAKDLGEAGDSINYGVIINAGTKIITKDYTPAIQMETKSIDVSKVAEKNGTINDIKNNLENSFVIVSAKTGNVPRQAGDFQASKIEVIINNNLNTK